jgi:hypothetical protein
VNQTAKNKIHKNRERFNAKQNDNWCFFNSFTSLLADYINVSKHLKRLKYPKVRYVIFDLSLDLEFFFIF